MTAAERAERVKQRARAAGFDTVGVTDLSPAPHDDALRRWLERGMAGTMRYMHRQAARRARPATILAGATRAVMLTRNYYSEDPPPPAAGMGRVARYARGRDYHAALAGPLAEVVAACVAEGGTPTVTRAYVDAGPVPERELAQRAGLGWIGKNTMLIDPARGSFFFIAAVLTDADLALDEPFTADRCGSCTACLDACPTDAIVAPRVLDATRCISYGTIEHRGPLPDVIAKHVGDWLFGCDVCNDVCPWNQRFASSANAMAMDPSRAYVALDRLATMSEEAFARAYGTTPVERAGLDGIRRTAAAIQSGGAP